MHPFLILCLKGEIQTMSTNMRFNNSYKVASLFIFKNFSRLKDSKTMGIKINQYSKILKINSNKFSFRKPKFH